MRLGEADLLNFKNFGKTSLREVRQKLQNVGLSLEMEVDDILGTTI